MSHGMKHARRVYLVGPRASGKTTVGKALAARAGWNFEDTDATVVATAGMTVEQIVEREGWEGFRRRETEALRATLGRDCLVAATGGGMVLADENRRMLREGGLVVYLRGSVDEPLYRECAHAVLDAGDGVQALVDRLVLLLEE